MSVFANAVVLVLGYMTVWFVVAIVSRRNDVADVAWGLGFVLLAWWGVFATGSQTGQFTRAFLAAILVTIWGVRLAVHIGRRNFARGSSEDARYAAWREEWGDRFLVRTYLQVFLLQGVLMLAVAAPLLVIAHAAGPELRWTDWFGTAVWAAGLALEVVADAQLARHLVVPTNRGKPLAGGVWGWSRHPNYLGDALAWWGIGIIALSAPGGWLGLVGPISITLLLRYVSGVPMLERRHVGDPAWEQYRARVGIFLPRAKAGRKRG